MSASYPSSPSGAVPAGWYPDVEEPGAERWWNGAQWTEHRRPVIDPTVAAAPPTSFGLAGVSLDKPATQAFAAAPSFGARASAPTVPPGWYPDPAGGPQPRWWDGHTWASPSAPVAAWGGGWPSSTTTVVNVGAPKSVGIAFLLTFFFGPLGMLYSTVPGALIMLAISFFGGIFFGLLTLGLIWIVWAPLMWVISIVWGCVAVPSHTSTTIYHR
ncbi:DUF2510 domain-containing protein [Nakamurella flava]|nr:DUF2510 domain-containing protein [Nakamurella flava]